jgi:heterodisulfide reductase subunit D
MLGKDEWCCASALVRTGQRDLMKEHAVHNIEALKDRGVKTVLFACAFCLRAASIDCPRWYVGYMPFKTMPLSAYLREKIRKGEGKDWAFEARRDVLQSIPGIEFAEMARNRALQCCCGAGGGVKGGIPDLALDMAQARVKDVEETGSQIVASTCPFCRRNIMDASTAADSPVKVVDAARDYGAVHGTGYDHTGESLHQGPRAGRRSLRSGLQIDRDGEGNGFIGV